MSLSSSLSAGIAGLQANSTRLAVISDNIANSATRGYRRGDVDFASLVIPGVENRYAAGGVRVTSYRDITTPGALISTGNATDIAISGRGMLPVTLETAVTDPANERPFQLTPTGSFQTNDEGYLVTRSGLALTAWRTDAGGQVPVGVVRDGPTDLEPIQVSQFYTTAEPTTAIKLGVNLPADATAAGASGDSYTSTIQYFDSIGRDNQLSVVYTPTVPATGSSNSWRVSFIDSAGNPAVPVAEYDIVFDATRAGRGSMLSVTPVAGGTYDATTGTAQITVADGPIDILIGSPGEAGGMTQLDAEFAPTTIIANGSPAGSLTGLEFDADGYLSGIYDTGQRVVLYKVPVVDVPNPNGLTALDNQAFAISGESGRAYLWDANSGPVGSVMGSTMQESTVDIARELTGLIQTQRAYSSNATIIKTVDEMLQETTNLKR